MPKALTTKEQLLDLHARYMAGESPKALSAEVGYKGSGLTLAFKNAGLPRLPRLRHAVEEDDPRVQSVVELWDGGLSAVRIADRMGLAPLTVRRILRRAGRDTSERHVARRSDARVTSDELRVLHARYRAGESPDDLGAEVGYVKKGLQQALIRAGLPLNARGPRPLPADDPRAQQAFALWDAGGGFREVDEQFGFHHRTFARLLKESGRDPAMRKRGPAHHKWRGGRYVSSDGYARVRVSPDDPMASMCNANGEIREHRLVLARALGRPLLPTETVHHINGDVLDNRLENLQLRLGQHGAGHAFRCADCGSHNIVAVEIDT